MAKAPKHSEARRASWRAHYYRYHDRHLRQMREQKRVWAQSHKEEIRKRNVAKYGNHPYSSLSESEKEDHRRRCRDWYRRNIDAQRLRGREKAKENRPIISEQAARRRAIKKSVRLGDPRLIAEWMREIRRQRVVRCHWCGTKIPGRRVHFDHVVALANGGPHSIGNLCASCPECNLSKQARALQDWISRGQTFLNL